LDSKTLMRFFRSLAAGPPSRLDECIDVAMSVEGQVSRAEVGALIELARDTPPGTVIVEIGTFRGRSTTALALGSMLGARNRVFAVDPHEEFTGVFGGRFGPEDQAALYRNIVAAGVGDVVAVVSLPSEAAARSWTDRNIGLLWIDGDHRYEVVSNDYKAWSGFVLADGTVAFHDRSAPGVAELLDELVLNRRLLPQGAVEALAWLKVMREPA
jgi:predicted O-methyltransferase YrrM